MNNLFQRFCSFPENKLNVVSFGKLMTELGVGIEAYDTKHLFR